MISVVENCRCRARISIIATGDDSADSALAAFRTSHSTCRFAGDETSANCECPFGMSFHAFNCPELPGELRAKPNTKEAREARRNLNLAYQRGDDT